jgi:hypothetical protein
VGFVTIKRDPERKWIIFGVITFGWILGTIGLGLTIEIPQNSVRTFEIVKLIFLSFGSYGVVTATYFSAFNTLVSSQNIQEKTNFDRTQNSFRFIERWDEPSLKEARDLTREITKARSSMSDDELKKRILNDPILERSVITAFNFWEGIWISQKHNRINEDLLKNAFAHTYINMYDNFGPWINNTRNSIMKTNLKDLYECWRSYLS